MKIVALTGSIGMGKSTTLAMFKERGVPVWDADAAVHRIYGQGGAAVDRVSAVFPQCLTKDNSIDREILSQLVLGHDDKLKQLEAIVHPLVGQDRSAFLAQARSDCASLVIIDVPLLFETGGQAHVDGVIVVSCDPVMQRTRVLARPNMTVDKFEAILARQLPDAQKRAKADYVIKTDRGLDDTRRQVGEVLAALIGSPIDESTQT
jgi:dephospho-CoA kinase